MAEKNKKNIEEIEAEAGKRLIDFMALCKCLFGDPEPPYDINELKPESPYYDMARKLAKDMELDWDLMLHADSNRVMLALLDHYYQEMNVDDDFVPVLQGIVKLKAKAKPKEKKKEKDGKV